MAKISLGNHAAVLFPIAERDKIRSFYFDLLGGTITKADPQRDFIRLGANFYFAFLYGDVPDDSERLRNRRSI